jgi:predicted nucleotidyltransferase
MVDRAINKDLIFQYILDNRKQLALYGIKSIGLFGSFVRGDQTPKSDIDILAEFMPDKHIFDNFMEAAFPLEKILGRKVELITPEALSPYIGPHILKEITR